MNRLFMGIDNGGTVTKAAIFDERGKQIGIASSRIETKFPAPGFVERDMASMWEITCDTIRDAIVNSGVDPKDIAGVACTGHGKGLYLWGKNDKPAYAGILSTDSRAWEYPLRWNKDGTASKAFAKTFQRILACQPVSLLAWLKEHEPGVIDNTRWIFEAKDYIRFMLTGEAFAEVTDYSGSGLINLAESRFDRDLLELYGIGEAYDLLPPLRYSTDLCGRVSSSASFKTGLVEGTPVAGGMFDIDACAVASGVVDGGKICVVAGTWSINEYISESPVVDGSVMMNSLFCLPGRFLIEESSPTSAGNYEWFTKLFLDSEKKSAAENGISLYAFAEKMAAEIGPDDQQIIFLPFVYGSNDNPEARACFLGLEASHTRAHLIRAVLEGIAFSHKTHLDRLLASRPRPAAIRMTGGAVNSAEWVRIFADVFEIPIETVEVEEPGALGAAMAAAAASGVYQTIDEAATYMTKSQRRVEPTPANFHAYRRKYWIYSQMAAALDGQWKDFRRPN
jgi:L-xylulokinase